jgi:hypothetical protein
MGVVVPTRCRLDHGLPLHDCARTIAPDAA